MSDYIIMHNEKWKLSSGDLDIDGEGDESRCADEDKNFGDGFVEDRLEGVKCKSLKRCGEFFMVHK